MGGSYGQFFKGISYIRLYGMMYDQQLLHGYGWCYGRSNEFCVTVGCVANAAGSVACDLLVN